MALACIIALFQIVVFLISVTNVEELSTSCQWMLMCLEMPREEKPKFIKFLSILPMHVTC